MLLAIDIGNTQIAAGLFKDDKLVSHWRMTSTVNRTEDEFWTVMKSICESLGYDICQTSAVAISSVVPNMTIAFQRLSIKFLKIEPIVVSNKTTGDIKLDYDNPAQVGADRICNAVAGYAKYHGPLIIVDLGTATTFDVIDANGVYLGGIIAPGIEMTSMILHEKAARLPRVELNFPDNVIGKSTETSMQSGLMYGTVEMVKGFVRRINEETGYNHKLVITGGLSKYIVRELGQDYILEPFLTLDGLNILYKKLK